jgi:hypothetical protein
MNAPIRRLSSTFLLAFVCIGSLQLAAQQKAIDTWGVLGSYTCSKWGDDASSTRLFLLPNENWTQIAPFEFSSSGLEWYGARFRNMHLRLAAFRPEGVFTVELGIVKLYNVELIDASDMRSLRPMPREKSPVKFDRPAALSPEPAAVQVLTLVERFSFDQTSGQLTEVLPLDSIKQPLRCQQKPLFTE